jgi:hypothetical protein
MTQTPHDQLAKQYLEEFLAPFGRIERQYEIPGEAKYVDVWFIPNPTTATDEAELGILGRMTETMCLLEPYRNAPTRNEIRTSILKLLWVQDNEQRIAQPDDRPITEDNLPRLWILAATVSAPVLTEASGLVKVAHPRTWANPRTGHPGSARSPRKPSQTQPDPATTCVLES